MTVITYLIATFISVNPKILFTFKKQFAIIKEKSLGVYMKKALLLTGIILLCLTVTALGCFAVSDGNSKATQSTVTMPTIFSDNMVLQADKPINVFGYCQTNGAQIKVALGENEGEATVRDGKWTVTLPKMEYQRGLTLTITEVGTSSSPIKLKNVDIGEVWVISGQSNATFEAYKLEDTAEYVANADNYDNIRVFGENKAFNHTENALKYGEGRWNIASSSYLKNASPDYSVSGTAYVMATRLAAELGEDVTVAILNLTVSGSGIIGWIPPEIIQEYEPDEYAKYLEQKEYYAKNRDWMPNSSPNEKVASVLYESEIKPYSGYTARGFIWWQGETDAVTSELTNLYPRRFSQLRDACIEAFSNDDLAFYLVQLHPYGSSSAESITRAAFRNMQYDLVSELENTYLISSSYEGMTLSHAEYNNNNNNGVYIHNARKSPVGLRIASSVLSSIYNINTDDKEASLVSSVINGNTLTLTFSTKLYFAYDNEAHGFEIAGADNKYYKANAVVENNKIVLSHPSVSTIKHVRYNYAKIYVELFDGTLVDYTTNSSFLGEYTNGKDRLGTIVYKGSNCYLLLKDKYYSIRTRQEGNLTDDNGIPICAFKISF